MRPYPNWRDYALMFTLVVCLVALWCCQGCGSLDRQYVAADRATYDALAPQIGKWIDADSTLSSTLADDYRGVVYSWGRRIDAGEELLEGSD
jgi:hypothetical protein